MSTITNILDRLREPSSFAGLGLAAHGLLSFLGSSEAEGVGQVVVQSAPAFAANPIVGGLTLAAGLAAMFMRERGDNGRSRS